MLSHSDMFINCSALPELMISDRHQKKEIRQLEQELPRWQVLVDSITGALHYTCQAPKMLTASGSVFSRYCSSDF